MTIKNWSQKVFWLLLVILPVQTGRHFWPEWSYINGFRIDYFSPTLYLTDLLIGGLFVLEVIKNLRGEKTRVSRGWWLVAAVGVLALFNTLFSFSPPLSAYKWVKILEFGWLGYWIYKNGRPTRLVLGLLLIPIAYQAILAVGQFILGSSIGGWWYFLGERSFNSSTPGIANTVIAGELILRPYGTFPHPNVLAGFLAVISLLVGAKIAWGKCGKRAYIGHDYLKKKIIFAGILSLGYGVLVLTLSRTAILGTTGLMALYLLPYFRGWRRFLIGGLAIAVVVVTIGGLWMTRESESAYFRERQYERAVNRIGQTPLFGTGLGTSPLYKYDVFDEPNRAQNYALSHQPIHSIYFLVLAETGIFGLLGLVGLLGWVLYLGWRNKSRLVFPVTAIALMGLVDHYFLTLQQGQLLMAVTLGFALGELKNRDFGYT